MALTRSEVVTATRNARRLTVVIERREALGAEEWWIMLGSGRVEVFDTASAALAAAKREAARGNRGVTISTIEWRNIEPGWRPPSA